MTTDSKSTRLKRQSCTNPLPEFTFFTDRDLGNLVPQMLSNAGLSIIRHDDLFSPTTSDTEWLCEVGKKGWIALTHNKSVKRQYVLPVNDN